MKNVAIIFIAGFVGGFGALIAAIDSKTQAIIAQNEERRAKASTEVQLPPQPAKPKVEELAEPPLDSFFVFRQGTYDAVEFRHLQLVSPLERHSFELILWDVKIYKDHGEGGYELLRTVKRTDKEFGLWLPLFIEKMEAEARSEKEFEKPKSTPRQINDGKQSAVA